MVVVVPVLLLQFAALQKDFSKRWANQSRAVGNLFKGPNQIEDIAGMQAG